ncbi:MAG: hypothetical protein ACYDCJ_01335 [Gammaproteobacteria bacterium]
MDSTLRNLIISLSAVVFFALAGCVQRSTKPDVVMVPGVDDGQIVRLMDYVNNVLSLPPAAQSVAQENLRQQFKLTQFPEDRMRLALLDSLLPKPVRNEGQAIALLSGYNWEAVGPGFKGLAALVLNFAKSQQANAADNQSLMQQLVTEHAQKDHLQQQLDALKSIEKTMNKRDKSIVTPPTSTISPAASSTPLAPATPPGERP